MSAAPKRPTKSNRVPASMPPRPRAKPVDPAACVAAIERMLNAQLDGYTRLLAVIEGQRDAIRSANPMALEHAAHEEESLVRTLAAIDAQRTQLVAVLGSREHPAQLGAMQSHATLSQALDAAAVESDVRSRLFGLAEELRTKVQAAKHAGAIVRDAANALARHMAGIQQTVHSALSRARVYERRGRLNPGSAMPATVDMKS